MSKRIYLIGAGVLVAAALGALAWRLWPDSETGDERLKAFVHGKLSVAIVFTSRTDPASFQAAAAEGDGFVYPGQPQWQAREGRLRILTPRGHVRELTWGVKLDDGDSLIDVMSPSISLDATKVFFAGRRQKDHGRFRLYEVGIDGRGLKQLTGGADDAGATALPPMRFREAKDDDWPLQALALTMLPASAAPLNLALAAVAGPPLVPDAERRRVDFDDVDLVELSSGKLAFASTRTPDFGRGHSRRASHIWVMNLDGTKKRSVTSNRSNDRWPVPYEMSGMMAFSQWSRNAEVITADRTDIRPYYPGMASATLPTDRWQGFRVAPNGDQFGMVLKLLIPVWRPQLLFNEHFVFMTSTDYGKPGWRHDAPANLTIAQAPVNLIQNVGSARPHDQPLPAQADNPIRFAPTLDEEGRKLILATPAPCPPNRILLSAAAADAGQTHAEPGRFGICVASENWDAGDDRPASASSFKMRLLFDDPELVDAEPVAVYPRVLNGIWGDLTANTVGYDKKKIELPGGRTYEGPVGRQNNGQLYFPNGHDVPGQVTDAGHGPILKEAPDGAIHHIRIFASYRDRFDHPWQPRIEGRWEYLLTPPTNPARNEFEAYLPAGVPTVLAGFTKDGKVAQWTTDAEDSTGRKATMFAFAGDHYSALPVGVQALCMGCHPGHTAIGTNEFVGGRK